MAPRRPLLVSQPDPDWDRDRGRGSSEEDPDGLRGLRGRSRGLRCSTPRRVGGRGGRGRGGRGGGAGGGMGNLQSVSPDGKNAAFIAQLESLGARRRERPGEAADDRWREGLRLRDRQRRLGSSDRAMLSWSPDSKKIATQQQDERNVGDMYLVNTTVGHPTLRAWKYPLPGDSVVAMLHRVIIDVETRDGHALRLPPEFHRATLGDNISMNDYNWSPDGIEARVRLDVARSQGRDAPRRRRDDRRGAERVRRNGARRTSSRAPAGACSGRRTRSSGTRSATTGASSTCTTCNTGTLKNQITTGDGPVTADHAHRREDAHDLVHAPTGASRDRIRTSGTSIAIGLDGTGYGLADARRRHPRRSSCRRRASTSSTRTRRRTCRRSSRCATRERQARSCRSRRPTSRSCSRPAGSRRCRSQMKAADGKTDIYGMMFRPTNFDPIEEVSDHQPHRTRARRAAASAPAPSRRRAATTGARRARLRRRLDRRPRHAGAIEVVPRRVLRRDGA